MEPDLSIFPLALEEKALRRAGRELEAAGLPTRLRNLLISAGYRSPEEIAATPVSSLRSVPGLGPSAKMELLIWQQSRLAARR